MVDQWKPTDPASAAHLNQLADAVNALLNLGMIGTGQFGSTGTTFDQTKVIEDEVFELTEDIKYPDPSDLTFPAGWSVPPDVPYAENCKQIWLKGGSNTYVTDSQPDETVYFPTDVDFNPADDPAITAGDRVQATYNTQRSRWEADVPTTAEVPEDPTATVILCLVNQTTVAITDDTFLVDTVTVISPFGGSTPTVTTVTNLLHFPSVEDNRCVAFLSAGTWYGIPEPPMETVAAVTEVDYTTGVTHAFQAKTTDVVVFAKAAESSFVTWHSAIQSTVVTDLTKDDDVLNYATEDFYGLEAGTNDGTIAWETLTTLDPVTDIDYNNSGSDHNFSKKETRGVQVFSKDGSGGAWDEDATWVTNPDQTWHETEEETLVVSVDKSSLLLRYQTEKTHALETFDTSANETWHTLVTVDPITALQYDSSPSPGTFDQKETKNVQVFAVDNVGTGWVEDADFATWHSMILVTDIVTDIQLNGDDLEMFQETANMVEELSNGSWNVWHGTASC